MTPLFSLDNVCFAYEGHIALRYITLDVARGETVVLQGSNGCGKSTLLKLLNGLVYAEEGTYKFDGDVINEKSLKDNTFSKKFHQRVGFIFQNSDVQLFCSNVEEEISFGPRQMGLSDEEVKQRTDLHPFHEPGSAGPRRTAGRPRPEDPGVARLLPPAAEGGGEDAPHLHPQ